MAKAAAVLACAGTLACVVASAQTLELEGRYWPATLTGQVRVTGGNAQAPDSLAVVDLKDDLGLTNKTLTDIRLSLTTGPHSRLRAGFVRMDYSADQIVDRTIDFNGQTYTVGTRVLTRLALDYWRYGWIWQFIDAHGGIVKLGTVLEAKTLSVDAALAAPNLTPPVAEAKRFTATLPTVGLALDVTPSSAVAVFAEVSGISAGSRGHAFDGEAGVRIAPSRFLTLSGGYRAFDVEARDDPDFAKIRNAGPWFGVGLRF
jgi:hypothetical protein